MVQSLYDGAVAGAVAISNAKQALEDVQKALDGGSNMTKKKDATWRWLLAGPKKIWISKKESECRKPYGFKEDNTLIAPEGLCYYEVCNDGSFYTSWSGMTGVAQRATGQACHWQWTYFKEHKAWAPQVKSGALGLATGAVMSDWS